METSDSECFESADEDIEFETAEPKIKSTVNLKQTPLEQNNLEVKDKSIAHQKQKNDLDRPEKPDRRKPRPKLGTKLGTKINESSSSTIIKPPLHREEVTEIPQPYVEPNLWENDDWEVGDSVVQQQQEVKSNENEDVNSLDNSSWSSWGNWGVNSILSTASTLTSQVSQGLTTVLESGIGAPDPVVLAKQDRTEKSDEPADQIFGISNLLSGVSQITKLVETTGTKVISGGLDTLETIGKKTMEVLQEGDPGFKKKRAFLKIDGNKPVLSQILREAKEKAENDNKVLEEKHYNKKANYEMLFDDHQGLVHLEALEMLSRQCDIKLETILESKSGADLIEMQETMAQVKELCELNDDDEEEVFNFDEMEEKLKLHVSEMSLNISYHRLISTWAEAQDWFNNVNLTVCNGLELHEQAIDTLAQLTAVCVEQFHKTGELLLIKEHRSTVDEADSLVQITTILTNFIGYVAKILSDKLNENSSRCKNQENINNLITNIYFEAANSSSYIKNAFQLLVPVLQVGAI